MLSDSSYLIFDRTTFSWIGTFIKLKLKSSNTISGNSIRIHHKMKLFHLSAPSTCLQIYEISTVPWFLYRSLDALWSTVNQIEIFRWPIYFCMYVRVFQNRVSKWKWSKNKVIYLKSMKRLFMMILFELVWFTSAEIKTSRFLK